LTATLSYFVDNKFKLIWRQISGQRQLATSNHVRNALQLFGRPQLWSRLDVELFLSMSVSIREAIIGIGGRFVRTGHMASSVDGGAMPGRNGNVPIQPNAFAPLQ